MIDSKDLEGEPPPETNDRDEAAFESGRTRREERREEQSVRRLLRTRAEDRARIAELEARLAQTEADRHKGRVTALDADLEAAERDTSAALAEGDTDKAAKAQRRMSELAAERQEARIRAEAPPPVRRQAAPPEVEDWRAANPWFQMKADGQHDAKTKLALIADAEAREVEGLTPDNKEYYQFINRRVNAKYPGTAKGHDPDPEPAQAHDLEDEPETPAPKRVAAGPAPVTRAPAAAPRSGQRQTSVRLTPAQVEMANSLGISPEKYAAQVARLGKDGAFNDARFMGVSR